MWNNLDWNTSNKTIKNEVSTECHETQVITLEQYISFVDKVHAIGLINLTNVQCLTWNLNIPFVSTQK